MNDFEKKTLNATIKNIIEKNLLEPILNNVTIKEQALGILNIASQKPNETEITKSFEDKFKYIDNKIKEMEKNAAEKKNELDKLIENNSQVKNEIDRLIKNKSQVKNEIDRLNDEKQNIEIYIKENKDIDSFIKEKRTKRYELNNEIAELNEKKQNIELELKLLENKKNQSNSLIEVVISDNKKREQEIIASYEAIIKAKKLTLSKEIENLVNDEKSKIEEIKELKKNIEFLNNDISRLKNEKQDIFQLESKLAFEKLEIERQKNEMENFKNNMSEYLNEVKEKAKESYENKLENLEELIRDLKDENEIQFNKIKRLENLNKPNYTLEELQKKIIEKDSEIVELQENLHGVNNEREEKIEHLKSMYRNEKEISNRLRAQNTELHNEKRTLLEYKERIETFEQTLPEFERSKEAMFVTIEKQRREIDELKNKRQSRSEKEKAIEDNNISFKIQNIQEFKEEKNWLYDIEKKFDEVGFKFPNRLLYAFHTSLKISDWSSLSILAGVSGTGKSELPRLYSRYGGINFLMLAVQPNWDGPHSLFGFYNSLEQKFNPTTLLKVLYQAQKDKNNLLSDLVTIVLLDEMNLAHVELYFSELLSKLESLRGKEQGEVIEIDLGENTPYEINLTNNVMWIGTMNEDETTKSLSDKVIDRGNLINFPKPKNLITRKKLIESEEAPKLLKSTWDSWKWNDDNENKLKEIIDNFKSVVEEINKALDGSGRAIGHRVWQSIEAYVKNYPLVIDNLNNKENLDKYSKIAFEDALVQKLIPKLRGLETSGDVRENCLDKIEEIIIKEAPGIAYDFKNALNNPYGVFVWISSSYLELNILE